MGDYDDLLKDPRWLLKRKGIIKRDGFKCTVCGSKENLQVHHTYYYQQKCYPWVYPEESLITLCEECHHNWHAWNENEYRDAPNRKIKKKKNKKRQITNRPSKEKKKELRTNERLRQQLRRKEITPNRYRKKTKDGYIYITKPPP